MRKYYFSRQRGKSYSATIFRLQLMYRMFFNALLHLSLGFIQTYEIWIDGERVYK